MRQRETENELCFYKLGSLKQNVSALTVDTSAQWTYLTLTNTLCLSRLSLWLKFVKIGPVSQVSHTFFFSLVLFYFV